MLTPLCSLQLEQDRSRAQEFLIQSLPYLMDAQASLREAALRFIGESQSPGSLSWQPGPGPHRCPGTRSSPVPARAPAAPCRALASPPSPAHTGGLGGCLAWSHHLSSCSPLGSALVRGGSRG